ncbi:hypothetical protein HBI25_111680 [Parastagonospora nodorum]|nr:hypothetical protein HBI25_111680 [Parastagonospora nodorum]
MLRNTPPRCATCRKRKDRRRWVCAGGVAVREAWEGGGEWIVVGSVRVREVLFGSNAHSDTTAIPNTDSNNDRVQPAAAHPIRTP